jgi:hypothetical protein
MLAVNFFIYNIWLPIIPASELDWYFSYGTLVKESRLKTGIILFVETDLEKAVPILILNDKTTSLVNGSSFYPSIG